MKRKETVAEFYTSHRRDYSQAGQFNVYQIEEFGCNVALLPNRRDFYKISIVTKGGGTLNYADKTVQLDPPYLTFLNPMIPYSWQPTVVNQAGYFCLFTDDFVDPVLKNQSLSQSPLFKVAGNPIFFPDKESMKLLKEIFKGMLSEIQSNYINKYELLRSYVQIIMHEAMKMQPPETYYKTANASERISTLFLELLEKQFPIELPNQRIRLKNANEFAIQLNIHTNTLNRALKEITGKTTTELIAERIAKEARALLQFSNWDIAEIAYCLGFEHSSNFIIFFKNQNEITPLQFRKTSVSI